jgi:hypothetical protein
MTERRPNRPTTEGEQKQARIEAGQVSPEIKPSKDINNASKAKESDIRDDQGKEQMPSEAVNERKPWPYSRDDSDYEGFIFGPFLSTPTRGSRLTMSNPTTRKKV